MKKFVIHAMMLGIASFAAAPGFSQIATANVNTQVTVNGNFSVTPNLGTLDMGTVNVGGDSPTAEILLNVQTNHGVVWTLGAQGTDLTGPGGAIIPVGNVEAFSLDGAGVHTPAPLFTFFPLTTTSQVFYTADPTEYTLGAAGLNIKFISHVRNAPSVTAGAYTGQVTITLADAI